MAAVSEQQQPPGIKTGEPSEQVSAKQPGLDELPARKAKKLGLQSISFDRELEHKLGKVAKSLERLDAEACDELELAADGSQQQPRIEATRKRYFILAMFVILHVVKSFQWICLASVTNVVARFYRVDNLAINWTTILFMVTFLFLAMPVSWLMEKINLRRALLIGSAGVTCGVTIKCFSCQHDAFAYCMLGHLIVGLVEPFFFSSFSQLASIWFPDNQVASATAFSVIGEQLGLALGFIIPPLMLGSNPDDELAVQRGLFRLFLAVALVSLLNTLSIVLFFDHQPRFAPGLARYKQMQQEAKRRRSSQAALAGELARRKLASAAPADEKLSSAELERKWHELNPSDRWLMRARELTLSVSQQMELSRNILADRHFLLLLVGFGLNVGTVYSIHTLLNQMITSVPQQLPEAPAAASEQQQQQVSLFGPAAWPGELEINLLVGNTGLISILAGLLGSGFCGHLLDKFHRHKLTMCSIYLLLLVSMLALTASLWFACPLALYLVAFSLGFAATGYASSGFDYGVEITYPTPELLSSTMLNISAQVFGIPISLLGSLIVDNYGGEALGLFLSALLALGFLATCFQGGQQRRQLAISESAGQSSSGALEADWPPARNMIDSSHINASAS